MPVPATKGVLRTAIKDMGIGDYITCYWSYNTNNFTQSVGGMSLNPLGTELPLENPTTSGNFYFIKVDKGLLIADRVTQVSVSWNVLNQHKCIQGIPKTFQKDWDGISDISGIIRSLTCGVAYANAKGDKSLTNQNLGSWPRNNEWDNYVMNFPGDKIQSGKSVDHIFNWSQSGSWCQDTPITGVERHVDGVIATNVMRSFPDRSSRLSFTAASSTNTIYGFRPVFEYKE